MHTEWIFAAIALGSIAWIGWVGWGYPAMVRALRWISGPRLHPRFARIPSVSFLVPCRNEEDFVASKAANLRELGAHLRSWEALMVDDNSTDLTGPILGRLEGAGIVVLRHAFRSGKIAALRTAARHARGEILVVTDCGCSVDPASLKALLEWFADPRVGLVTGAYRPQPSKADSRSESEMGYWDGETRLREAESALGSTTHATGALFAVRSGLFSKVEWPEGTINDDIHLPLRILELGYDVVCEPRAVAVEPVETDPEGEFRRRIRIASGNFQAMREIPRMIASWRIFPLVQLLSHKLMRNALGIPFLGIVVASAGLSTHPVFLTAFLLELAALGVLATGYRLQKRLRLPALLGRSIYVGSALVASLVGLVRWLEGATKSTWERTDRLTGVGHV